MTKPQPNKHKHWILWIMIPANLVIAAGTLFSAYAGFISPEVWAPAGLACLTFPIWVVISVIFFLADLFTCKPLSIIPVITLFGCWDPLLDYCPLNVGARNGTEKAQRHQVTILSYNVMHFINAQGEADTISRNRTIDYIIDTDADIVCLQECETLKAITQYDIRQEQIDSLLSQYPYNHIGHSGQTVLSKYPFTHVQLAVPDGMQGGMEAYKVNINNDSISLFNVHLQSIQLTEDDRELFLELTDTPSKHSLKQAKPQLLSKLVTAFRQRGKQALALSDFISHIDGNIIVCGDFNDVPNCYAMQQLRDIGMKDAFRLKGCGMKITYNMNRFYFRIDHVLFKGHGLDVVSIRRGNIRSSDHFPLLTTFLLND